MVNEYEKYENEKYVHSELKSKNRYIIEYFDYFTEDSKYFILMEFCEV